MGIISSDTLEGSDTLNKNAKYSDGKKKETLPNKSPCNQDYSRETRHGKTLLSPPQTVSGFPSLAMWARTPPAQQCPCREAGVASPPALCRWVAGLSLGGCHEEHPGCALSHLLHSSSRSSGFHLLIEPVCVAAVTPWVRYHNCFPWFPITKTLTANHLDQTGYLGFAVLDLVV